ncbi:DUF2207 domain-containing protein [Tessaracoccus palaemonis]|uniref:DUF2207 domain-containing protein n=1 Tax=Tessaracoccus palaemonis TaxID=2829499 RepID=A0ABX8SND6_9ACTN|nr:DUF2207 domain-containing protein [Tessaracoccus palaemonis]QXT62699.1 DUF2207 domain-containing protein [Tessaracoccus palaemonis]
MDSMDLGFIVIAVVVSALLLMLGALSRRFFHDRIYVGVTPGLTPVGGQAVREDRVQPGPEYAGTVAVAFSPPRGLTPGLVGTVVDGVAEMRDITATIVDLARRGHVVIRAVDVDSRRVDDPRKKARDWEVSYADGPPPGDPLEPFEKQLLRSLLGKGRTATRGPVSVSSWAKHHREEVRQLRDHLYAQTVRRGWYAKDPRPRRGGCLPILGIVLVVLWCVAMLLTGFSWVKLAAAVLLIGSAVFARVRFRRREPRTALGTAVRIQALGFKQYLATAEAKQFSFEEAAGIFSRYLPYAIVFGVSAHWAKVFGEVLEAHGNEIGAGDAALMALDAMSQLAWFDAAGAGLDLLDIGDAFDGFDIGDAIDGIGDLADGVGDFISGLDFLDFG